MNLKYQLLVAAAALSLGACSTDDTSTGPENEGYKISFTVAEDAETRTTLDKGADGRDYLQWVPTDEVGIYTVGKNENPNTLTVADVNQHPVEFIGVLKKLVSPGDMFYAYYPYSASQSTNPSSVKLTIPAEQKQTQAGVYNGESHPLVALPMAFPWERDSKACRMSSVRFRQLGSIVELQLFSSNEALRSEKIHSVTFESDTPLAGDFSFNLTTVTVDDELKISGYESKVATTSLEEPAAIPATASEAARIYLTIAPGTYTGKIVVKTDVAQYTFNLAKAMTFERAAIQGLPADLAEATREAPVTENDLIHFEDQVVKGICIDNWDENGDGELSYKEAAAVTSIETKFKGKSIHSFNELRYFTGLRSIGWTAFSDCSNLTSINLPDGLSTIGDDAFYKCTNLTSIHIPNGVTAIGNFAFWSCRSLTSIHLPDGVTTIDEGAFWDCSSLTSITIPQTVSSIGGRVFARCSSLSAFYGKYASADNRCLIMDGALLAFAPADLTEYEYTIPDGVTMIGESAFLDCSRLTSITIPDKVTLFREYAFEGCSSLTNVYCKPTTPPTLGFKAFYDTRSSKKIHVPTVSVEKYKAAKGWSTYASQIVADNN